MSRESRRSLSTGVLPTRRSSASTTKTGKLARGGLRWLRVVFLGLFVAPLLATSGDPRSPLVAGVALLVVPACLVLLLLRLGDRLLPAQWALPGGIMVRRRPLALGLTLLTVALLTVGSVALPAAQGRRTAAAPRSQPQPTLIPDMGDVVQIAATLRGSLALNSDGSVWGWGDVLQGGVRHYAPAPICTSGSWDTCVPLGGVAKLYAGKDRVFVIKTDGTLWGWGDNANGQLGDGTKTNRTYPVQAAGITNVVAVASGYPATFAITSTGKLWSWGHAMWGILGDGVLPNDGPDETREQLTPQQLSGLPDMVTVTTYIYRAAAVDVNGHVWTWGYDEGGLLARGNLDRCAQSSGTCGVTPGLVSGLSDIVNVAMTNFDTLALTNDGAVWAWGNNLHGELGDGSTTDRATPVLSLATDVVALATFEARVGAATTGGGALF